MNCPGCGCVVQEADRFCAKCGVPTGDRPTSVRGASKIAMEPTLVNALLAVYANKPNGPQLRLESGRLKVQVGGHGLDINPLHLEDVAQGVLQAGPLGSLSLSIDSLRVGEQGLEVQLRLD